MEHSPAYIIARYLIGQTLLSDPTVSGAWPVYVGVLPDGDKTVDDIAMSMDTAGLKDGRLMNTGKNIIHEGVQLMVRAEAYNTGYEKTRALATALEGVDGNQITIGTSTYQIDNVSQTSSVMVLGQEEGTKRRELFSVNFLITLKEV